MTNGCAKIDTMRTVSRHLKESVVLAAKDTCVCFASFIPPYT